jgi:DNA-binding IclR family transcriptional regulator
MQSSNMKTKSTRTAKEADETSAAEKRRKPTAVTGLQIVELLANNPRGVRLGEIADAIQMDPAQTHRMISAMLADGWVMPIGNDGSYSLTARVIKLSSRYISRLDLSEHARPLLDMLADQSRESVFLGELRKDVVVCVGRRVADHSLRVWTEMGDSWPLEGTAVGTAILAARFVRLSPNAEPIGLSQGIMDAMRDGYARDYGRYREGIEAVAAPIRDAAGMEIGAIALSGPSTRMSVDRIKLLGKLVQEAGIQISERLGYIPNPAAVAGRRVPATETTLVK